MEFFQRNAITSSSNESMDFFQRNATQATNNNADFFHRNSIKQGKEAAKKLIQPQEPENPWYSYIPSVFEGAGIFDNGTLKPEDAAPMQTQEAEIQNRIDILQDKVDPAVIDRWKQQQEGAKRETFKTTQQAYQDNPHQRNIISYGIQAPVQEVNSIFKTGADVINNPNLDYMQHLKDVNKEYMAPLKDTSMEVKPSSSGEFAGALASQTDNPYFAAGLSFLGGVGADTAMLAVDPTMYQPVTILGKIAKLGKLSELDTAVSAMKKAGMTDKDISLVQNAMKSQAKTELPVKESVIEPKNDSLPPESVITPEPLKEPRISDVVKPEEPAQQAGFDVFDNQLKDEEKYFVRYTENPERDLEHPQSFVAIHEDREYLETLSDNVIQIDKNTYGIPLDIEGLNGYEFNTLEEAKKFISQKHDISGNPWMENPPHIFTGKYISDDGMGFDVFKPSKLLNLEKKQLESIQSGFDVLKEAGILKGKNLDVMSAKNELTSRGVISKDMSIHEWARIYKKAKSIKENELPVNSNKILDEYIIKDTGNGKIFKPEAKLQLQGVKIGKEYSDGKIFVSNKELEKIKYPETKQAESIYQNTVELGAGPDLVKEAKKVLNNIREYSREKYLDVPEEIENQYIRIKDSWHGNRDIDTQKAINDTAKLQDEIAKNAGDKSLTGKPKYGNNAKMYDKAIQLYIDLKGAPDDIIKYYNSLNPEQKKLVDLSQNLPLWAQDIGEKIIQLNKVSGQEGLAADVLHNLKENYTGRIWDFEKAKTGGSKFQTRTGHSKERTLSSILEGWSKGYNLKVEGSTNAHGVVRQELSNVINDRKLIDELKTMKTIDSATNKVVPIVSTQQLDGYVRLEHPGFRAWKWAGKAEEGQTYGRNIFMDDAGNIFQREEIYAPKSIANNLNNMMGYSKLREIGAFNSARKLNAWMKRNVFVTSLFHHVSLLNAFEFGIQHKWAFANPLKSYQEGLQALKALEPEVETLIRKGMTVGRIQEFDEALLKQKTFIENWLTKNRITGDAAQKTLDFIDNWNDFLFKKWGTGLKVKAGLIQYKYYLEKYPQKDPEEIAKMVADIMNHNFGGQHLQRLGRNPNSQDVFHLLALAPDWTESNLRLFTRGLMAGDKVEREMYKRFWANAIIKTVAITAGINLMLNGGDTWKSYKDTMMENGKFSWKKFSRLNWLGSIDITPIYKAMQDAGLLSKEKFDPKKNRKYFDLIGHLKDPFKWMLSPVETGEGKTSVLAKVGTEFASGHNFYGKRFTNIGTLRKQGNLVEKNNEKGAITNPQIPSGLLYEIKNTVPLPAQNLISWIEGEQTGLDAILKSSGFRITSGRSEKYQYDKNSNRRRERTKHR